jgi:hypothetical protein
MEGEVCRIGTCKGFMGAAAPAPPPPPPHYSGGDFPIATLPTTNLSCFDLGPNADLSDEKSVGAFEPGIANKQYSLQQKRDRDAKSVSNLALCGSPH